MKNRRAFSLIELSIVILVIGILVAGIAKSGSLIAKAKLASARSQTSSSIVASTDNLIMWLEATSKDSFGKKEAVNDSAITNWYDINPQSTSKNNAVSSGSSRPIYKSDCINSLPCLNFTAANSNYMTTSRSLGYKEQITIFLVVNFKTLDASAVRAILATDGVWTSGNIHYNTEANSNLNYAVNSPSVTNHYSGDDTINTSVPYIFSVTDDKATATFHSNGVATGTPAAAIVGKNLNIFSLASWYDGSSRARFSDMYLGELIIFGRALTKEERVNVTSYLSQKWGIKVTQ